MALRAVLQAAAEVGRRCEQLRAEWEGREGALAHEAAGLEARMLSQAVCFERRRDRFRAENARLRKENRELREERERWERECARLKDDFLSLQAGYTSLLHACEAKLISLRSCPTSNSTPSLSSLPLRVPPELPSARINHPSSSRPGGSARSACASHPSPPATHLSNQRTQQELALPLASPRLTTPLPPPPLFTPRNDRADKCCVTPAETSRLDGTGMRIGTLGGREEDCEYTANIEGDSEYTRSIEEGADHSSSVAGDKASETSGRSRRAAACPSPIPLPSSPPNPLLSSPLVDALLCLASANVFPTYFP